MSNSLLVLPITVFFILLLAAQAQRCPRGQFLDNDTCVKCPPGTWKSNPFIQQCTACPQGTYNPYSGAQGIDVCKECPENTFNNVNRATSESQCLPCPSGQFAPPGSIECIRCNPGERAVIAGPPGSPGIDLFYAFFRAVQFLCFEGTSLEPELTCTYDAPIEYECRRCPFSSFTDSPNAALECDSCPSGTSSFTDPTKCLRPSACLPGFYRPTNGPCFQCPRFQVSDGTSPTCRDCPPGFGPDAQNGGSKCVPCPAGTAKDNSQSQCTACKPGENSFVTGAEFCYPDKTQCAPNFFRNSNGACIQCTAGQRFDANSKRCVSCPKNSLSKGALSTTCSPCPPGTRASIAQARCICKPGYEVAGGSGAASRRCRKCRPGTFRGPDTSSRNSELPVCQQCPRNTFARRAGMKACTPCPKGSRQPRLGQRKCLKFPPCRRGLISSDNFGCVNPETNCPPKYMRVQEADAFPADCRPRTCPPGLALLQNRFCGVCAKGEYYDAQFEFCRSCSEDETSNGGLTRTCTSCSDGMLGAGGRCLCIGQREMKNGKCTKCPKGTYGFEDRSGCEPCHPGTFSDREGASKCRNCRAGTFTDEAGSSSCKPCPSGTTTFGQGESECVRPGSLED